MSTEEFISSGILESYVLGTASADEINLVWEMQGLHPEVVREIEAIENALMEYAGADVKMPSESLKNKIQQELFSSATRTVTPAPVAATPAAKVLQMPAPETASSNVFRYAAAASIALLIGSAVFNFVLYNKLNSTKQELADLHSEKEVLANQFQVQQTSLTEKSNELAMIVKPGNKMISLKGMDLSLESAAMIIWNTNDKSVMLGTASLPTPPEGKQYQLWALVDGKPVDAGVFTMQDGKFVMQKMKDMPNAQAFAVTLEKAGGSPVPTMDAMYLIGNV